MADYYLGVDGGQSSTTALIGDETGRVIGHARGGPCNHVSTEEARAKFMRVIGQMVFQALESAKLEAQTEFAAACMGFSGGPADKESILAEMFKIRKRIVTNDALIALTGATEGAPGIITIAGTGSISFGRNAAGKQVRVGGWGYVYGDEGGGFDVTRQALRAALRMEEGWGPETRLRAMLLESTGTKSCNELLHKFYTPDFPRPRIAAMSKIVEEAASGGDMVADDILRVAAQQLSSLALAARKMLFAAGEPARVCPIGGVFKNATVRGEFERIVGGVEGNSVESPKYGPAAGALLEAYRLDSLSPVLQGVPEAEK
jgi:N-acetylglucosamine kinase-like BadF-type ATPase